MNFDKNIVFCCCCFSLLAEHFFKSLPFVLSNIKAQLFFITIVSQRKIVSGSLTDVAKLVNLRTSFLICQEPLNHFSCGSPLSPRRGDRFTLRSVR